MISGVCNKDLRDRLFPSPAASPKAIKRRSALISRKPRLLRAHGILHEVSGRNLYRVSETGRGVQTAFLVARRAMVNQLM